MGHITTTSNTREITRINRSTHQQIKGEIDELRQRRQGLVSQLEQLLLVYQEGYPDVISLRAQIAELDAAIHAAQESGGDIYTGRGEAVENPLYEELRRQLSVAKVDLRGQKRRMESLVQHFFIHIARDIVVARQFR